ncbi:hypothetical protein ACLB0R_10300 [Sphingomonas sp. GlSt437]|uniref:hypothetical protein n=1 Tax=Sphingomonas sp. GlSt437 TaxID=3389970 RepID=UPI003A84AD68
MIDAFCNLEAIDGNQPWCDLSFEVVSKRQALFSDRNTLTIEAVADGRPIGLAIVSRANDWRYQRVENVQEELGFWWGKLTLLTVGAKSDALLATWRNYFGLPGASSFAREIVCRAVALSGDPRRMDEEVVRAKLFFDNGEPDEYAELFCIVDLAGGFAALNEKDPDYRSPLVSWCSGAFGHA